MNKIETNEFVTLSETPRWEAVANNWAKSSSKVERFVGGLELGLLSFCNGLYYGASAAMKSPVTGYLFNACIQGFSLAWTDFVNTVQKTLQCFGEIFYAPYGMVIDPAETIEWHTRLFSETKIDDQEMINLKNEKEQIEKQLIKLKENQKIEIDTLNIDHIKKLDAALKMKEKLHENEIRNLNKKLLVQKEQPILAPQKNVDKEEISKVKLQPLSFKEINPTEKDPIFIKAKKEDRCAIFINKERNFIQEDRQSLFPTKVTKVEEISKDLVRVEYTGTSMTLRYIYLKSSSKFTNLNQVQPFSSVVVIQDKETKTIALDDERTVTETIETGTSKVNGKGKVTQITVDKDNTATITITSELNHEIQEKFTIA